MRSSVNIGVIALILLVAAALRLWGLPGIPSGPHYDEAANAVLAAEIAKGDRTSIFIPSFTGKEVLFFYGAAAAMRLFGVDLLALRLTSALVGVLTVAASAWLAYELFADDEHEGAPWLAWLTATLIATSFWHVLLSRLGFRAITQPLLQALTLAALWRGLRQRPVRRFAVDACAKLVEGLRLKDQRWTLLGGFFCGLTGYTYLASRAFPIPLAIAFVALLIFDVGHRRQRLVQITLFGLAALVTFAPLGLYFVRNSDAFTTRMRQVGPGEDWDAALNGIVAAAKMIFWQGDPYIRFNLPFRPLFGPVIALFLVVGLVVTLWRLLSPRRTSGSPALGRVRDLLLIVWLPVMLLPTALAVNEITPSNLRAIGLIPLIFILPARGVLRVAYCVLRIAYCVSLVPVAKRSGKRITHHASRITNYPLLSVTGLLLIATAFTTARTYFRDYAPRTDLYEVSDGDLADIAAYLNRTDLSGTTVFVGSIHYRHPTLAILADAYAQIKWLVGASTLVYPALGDALYLFPRSAAPDTEWLALHLPDAVPIAAPVASDGGPAFTGYRLAAPSRPNAGPVEPHDPSEDVLADFSGVVRLLSYQVERAISGDRVAVTLIWQVLASPPHADLTPFYHLVDPWGLLWGQAEPFHYAAEDWTLDEIVVDRVWVPVAPGAPPGDYLLEVGLYSQSTGTRLAVVDTTGRHVGTTVPLTVTVARAEAPPDPATLGIRQRLDLKIDAGLTLLGADLETTQARPGERIHLTLFWRADQDRADLVVHLYVQDVAGDDLSLHRGAPVHGTYPLSRWVDGEIVVDRYNPRLPLAAANASPGNYPLVLSLMNSDGATRLDSLLLGQLNLIATDRNFTVPAIRNTLHVTLADQIGLLGYDIEREELHPGETIQLTLYWRAVTEMDTSYTVFTHLLGPDGQVVAQQDNLPIKGTYPTALWLPGEIITDPYEISIPTDLHPGDYTIQVGFYIAENGLRLSDPVPLDTVVSVSP
jgi:4-amino-4-deoxy-L-arabinose transferase-like glycosyltransferase